jgi:thioredoxin-dependent adenylylsulfate APS reductase
MLAVDDTARSAPVRAVPGRDETEGWSAERVLEWGLRELPGRISLASSFQAEESVLIDLLAKVAGRTGLPYRVFMLDTGRLNQETYDLVDVVRDRYGLMVEVFFPEVLKVQEMVRERGLNLFYRSVENRVLCCDVRKVEPLRRALSSLDGWITGLRREQVATRANAPKIEIDHANGGLVKLNPLADWKEAQVWEYVKSKGLPYNALYDKGFRSIGCEPCTRAVAPDEDPRAGRWWWEQGTKECGLHFKHEDAAPSR